MLLMKIFGIGRMRQIDRDIGARPVGCTVSYSTRVRVGCPDGYAHVTTCLGARRTPVRRRHSGRSVGRPDRRSDASTAVWVASLDCLDP